VQIDMDYRTVGKNRDIDLGLVGDPGAILGAVLLAASGRIKGDKRQARQQWLKQLSEGEGGRHRKSSCRSSNRTACRFTRTGSLGN